MFYVDGRRVSSAPVIGPLRANAADLLIGRASWTPTYPTIGEIETLAILDRPLEPERIAHLLPPRRQANPSEESR